MWEDPRTRGKSMEVLEEASNFSSGRKLIIEEVRRIKWYILPVT